MVRKLRLREEPSTQAEPGAAGGLGSPAEERVGLRGGFERRYGFGASPGDGGVASGFRCEVRAGLRHGLACGAGYASPIAGVVRGGEICPRKGL